MAQKSAFRMGDTSLNAALSQGANFLRDREDIADTQELESKLWSSRGLLAATVASHLRLETSTCRILPPKFWIQGSTNLCIPVLAGNKDQGTRHRLLLRVAMPHMHAIRHYPDALDDKVNTEAATYMWMQRHCSDIRIPKLYAFAFSDGAQFTHVDLQPWHVRVRHRFRQWLYELLKWPMVGQYVPQRSAPETGIAFMLLEYIDRSVGKPFAFTRKKYSNDPVKRTNLYHGISRIMASLARIPQPRIGSFRFDRERGTVSLTNRPMNVAVMVTESAGSPRVIQTGQTYGDPLTFASDMLSVFDNFLLHEPLSVLNPTDARDRLTARVMLRALLHTFIPLERRYGPYLVQPTDLNAGNLFVDDDWNVTCMVDLEWINALPAEALSVNPWMTPTPFDMITDEYEHYEAERNKFLAILAEIECEKRLEHNINLVRTMEQSWKSRSIWFWDSLRYTNAWEGVFEDHLLTKYSTDRKLVQNLRRLSKLFCEDSETVVKRMVADARAYEAKSSKD
ncbi:hypothetical protein BDZ85DRAFT_275887 [Elsinoe ampelina]|uniref:Aminoglycoside phosphotransferase domain-containing protein n=1 Tax=Elsinoe ampelina TaxID=302913 RepID=A0A6A6G3I7_9PEZI|nr:hypothetical protein BDZ85DRAFT_275887 [Elsinoe ampelina]